MSKSWEEEWHRGNGDAGEDPWSVYDAKGGLVCERFISADDIQVTTAAPDMARAGLAAVNDVVANFAPNVGPMTADDIIGTGLETVEIPMKQFATLVAALRKAGAL